MKLEISSYPSADSLGFPTVRIIICHGLDIRVPEIVEAHVFLDAGHFQQLAVDPGHRVRAPVAAGAGRWEQDGVVRVLFMLPHQDIHRLLGQRHPADGVLGLRLGHHQLTVDAGDLLAHREDAVLHVQVIPQQRQQLPSPQAAG